MRTSESLTNIAPALLKAQEKISAVAKKGKADTGKFKYEYAELPDVIDECKKHLNENGIVVLQPIAGDMVQTRLQHTSGEFMEDEGTRIVCARENDPQAYGAAVTYARRYSLLSNLFMPTADDDAQSAMPRQQNQTEVRDNRPVSSPAQRPTQTSETPQRPLEGKASEAQIKAIFAISKGKGMTEEEVKERYGIESISGLTKQQASDLITRLNSL